MVQNGDDKRAVGNLFNAELAGSTGAVVATVMTKDGFSTPKKVAAVAAASAFVPIMEEAVETFQERFMPKEKARSFVERAEEGPVSGRGR